MKTLKAKMKLEEITEGHFYVTDKGWKFGLDDGKEKQFGLYIEIVNMDDATGEDEYKDYPYLVSMSIVPDKVHKSFHEEGSNGSKLGLILDAVSYCGGVCVEHTLVNGVNKGLEEILPLFNVGEAMLKTVKSDFGTIAAQEGKGAEFRYLQFKTYDVARKYAEWVIEHRTMALPMMIGFILDKPINLAGNTGWETMNTLVNGSQYKTK